MPNEQQGNWKQSFKDAVEDAMKDMPVNSTRIIEAIEVRKLNPVHEFRVILRGNP